MSEEISKDCKCIDCGKDFDKYGVLHFRTFKICDNCLSLYPGIRDDGPMKEYYKAKEKNK